MPETQKTCERCGGGFLCCTDSQQTCWCVALPPLSDIPPQYQDCLCPQCLRLFAKGVPQEFAPLQEGKDFYLEKGRWVFTAQYHLNKGFCCGNGCRHCPY